MQRRHRMPFGAELEADAVRFRLWAPAVDRLELSLPAAGGERRMPMTAAGDGWFECRVADAGAGSRYRYRLPDGLQVPDPATRFQPDDVHGASEVIDPAAFDWPDGDWRGRPLEEAVFYELHVGSFTAAGSFAAAGARLEALADLGVTALELMPLADFPGARNWGYDGVYPFAPDSRYGRPEDLKRLVARAHGFGLMVFLDVVYNHFGPEGNYLHRYAPTFFSRAHRTPWGAAINFDGPDSATVREFVVHNALYWLEEFHLDGLRLDAVHAICDDSTPDIVEQLAAAVQRGPGAARAVHLVLENDHNAARYLARDRAGRPRAGSAQWNDDCHHALHVLVTGETDGYYGDFAADPARHLGRCLAEGFAWQGEASPFRDGAARGEPSAALPPAAFVNFLQNHDQIGNRALGERIDRLAEPAALRAATAVLLLAPALPLLFMGQEWAADSPFPFFCDLGADLAAAVTAGRRAEFARFARFRDPAARNAIPDPNDPRTFTRAVLDWSQRECAPHAEWLALHRELLALRRRAIVPRLRGTQPVRARYRVAGATAVRVEWRLADRAVLTLMANLGAQPLAAGPRPVGALLYATPGAAAGGALPPWSAAWFLAADGAPGP